MQSPESSDETHPVQPTAQDFENERIRQEIAARQEAEYGACLRLAMGAFGPGWLPACRHFLVDRNEEQRCRYTNERPLPEATVYTVKNAAGERRHFTVEDGKVVKHESYEAGFGSMLLEPHPSQGFVHNGVFVKTHRFSLCWAPFELYHPKSAEHLAALRVSRERNKAARELQQWIDDNPLLVHAGILPED